MHIGETLYVASRQEWRRWLAKHHQDKKGIWLIIYKKSAGKQGIVLEEAVEEALCYGWIDSQLQPIDAEKYALRFSPRRPSGHWAKSNRKRALKLLRAGKMTKGGMAVLPPELVKAWKSGKKPEEKK